MAGRHADDRDLAELIGELSMRSGAFAALWSRHPVQTCVSGTKRLRHPVVGELDLDFEMLHLPGDAGHRLMTYPAAPGTAAEAALRLLQADLGAEPVAVRAGGRADVR